MNVTKEQWMRISVCACTSTRLSCASLRLVPLLAYFQTTPSSYALILDFVLLKAQLLYFSITQHGSMKYLIFGGKEYIELGAWVSLHNHLRSHASPFQATSTTISAGNTLLKNQRWNSGYTVLMLPAFLILSSSGRMP